MIEIGTDIDHSIPCHAFKEIKEIHFAYSTFTCCINRFRNLNEFIVVTWWWFIQHET